MLRKFFKKSGSSSERSSAVSTQTSSNSGDSVQSAGFELSKTPSLTLMKIPASQHTDFANYFNSLTGFKPGVLGSGNTTVPHAPGVKLTPHDFWRYRRRIDFNKGKDSNLSKAGDIVWSHIFGTEPLSTEDPYPGLTEPEPKSTMSEEERLAWNTLKTCLGESDGGLEIQKYAIDGLHSIIDGDLLFAWRAVDVISESKPEGSTARA